MSDTPEKWIFSYRRTGRRDLTQSERDLFTRRGKSARLRTFGWALLAVLAFFAVFTLFMVAIDGPKLWWLAALMAIIGFFKLIGLASASETFALLNRRVARRGKLDRFEPRVRPERLRTVPLDPEDDESFEPYPYWKEDEKFEEQIARLCGHRPEWFETPAEDDVLITIEGKPIDRVLNVASIVVAKAAN